MKSKVITLVFIVLSSTLSFSESVFLDGFFSVAPHVNITGFQSRAVKTQPGFNAEAGFNINFNEYLFTGLQAGINYSASSSVDGGWSYPGFTGFETGASFGFSIPPSDFISIQLEGTAGWYRYNLTDNFFFLPSVELTPGFKLFSEENITLSAEIPVRYFFHKQADIFMSAGFGMRLNIR